MELIIDTSTRYASVAVSVNGAISRELLWRSDKNHSVELVPAINEILRMKGAVIKDVENIVVCLGPGAFSALRSDHTTHYYLYLKHPNSFVK